MNRRGFIKELSTTLVGFYLIPPKFGNEIVFDRDYKDGWDNLVKFVLANYDISRQFIMEVN